MKSLLRRGIWKHLWPLWVQLRPGSRGPVTTHVRFAPKAAVGHQNFGNIAVVGAVLRSTPIGEQRRLCFLDNRV
jgi:hypothetical protein